MSPMAKVVPFPTRRVQRTAAYVLNLSARWARLNKPQLWTNRPEPPESLGNMLQHLLIVRPGAVLLIENLVAEILAQIGSASG